VVVRYEDADGILRAGRPAPLGRTPLRRTPLAMGSYLVLLRHPRFPEVRYPVHITRNRAWKGRVVFRTADETGEGFVHVPAGPFVSGDGNEARIVELDDFALAERPVTFADWAEYLQAVEREQGIAAATARCPGTPGDGPFMERSPSGAWKIRRGLLDPTVEAAHVARHGTGSEVRWPVMAISWHDAAAWCEWKSRSTGREWRLPTDQELEKAFRGVDGRAFPWGDLADPTLAKCSESRKEPSQPEPVGSFPDAASVYGVVDAAGNVWQWTSSYSDSRAAMRVVHGGSWNNNVSALRCSYRFQREPDFRGSACGFRPARSYA